MDLLILAIAIVSAAYFVKLSQERQRIGLLSSHLGHYQIEKLMEQLTQGYLRALGEENVSRREQIWQLLESSETRLCEQFSNFVAEISLVEASQVYVTRWSVTLPYANKLFPNTAFDLRRALAIHAQGMRRVVENNSQHTPKAKAFMLLAELLLMQHTCHWFCKSKTVASARMLLLHQTHYEQALAAVSPETRLVYCTLVE